MSGPLFIGVDVGTQGTKALVYEQKTGKVVSRGAKAYDIQKTNVPGRAEQHPSLWIEVSGPIQIHASWHRREAALQGTAQAYFITT